MCYMLNFPLFTIIDTKKAQTTEEDKAQKVLPTAKYLEFKYWKLCNGLTLLKVGNNHQRKKAPINVIVEVE